MKLLIGLFTFSILSTAAFATQHQDKIEPFKLTQEVSMVFSSAEYSQAILAARASAAQQKCDEIGFTKIFQEEAQDGKSSQVKIVLRAYRRPAGGAVELCAVGVVYADIVYQTNAPPQLANFRYEAPVLNSKE